VALFPILDVWHYPKVFYALIRVCVVLQGWRPIQRHRGSIAARSYQDACHNHIGHGSDILVINQPLIKLAINPAEMYACDL